jgi:hypothetical protein
MPPRHRWGIEEESRRAWHPALLALALVLFPGLGTVGASIAFIASWMMRSSFGAAAAGIRTAGWSSRSSKGATRLLAGETRSRVGSPPSGSVTTSTQAILDLKRQLADPDLDIRGQAAVALSRVGKDWHASIDAASVRVRAAPAMAQPYLNLADVYSRCSASGFLDPVSARFYLIRAQEALDVAWRLEPNGAAGPALTQVQHELKALPLVGS